MNFDEWFLRERFMVSTPLHWHYRRYDGGAVHPLIIIQTEMYRRAGKRSDDSVDELAGNMMALLNSLAAATLVLPTDIMGMINGVYNDVAREVALAESERNYSRLVMSVNEAIEKLRIRARSDLRIEEFGTVWPDAVTGSTPEAKPSGSTPATTGDATSLG